MVSTPQLTPSLAREPDKHGPIDASSATAPAFAGLEVCAGHADRNALAEVVVRLLARVATLESALEAAANRGTVLTLTASLRARAAEESLAVAQASLAELQGRIRRVVATSWARYCHPPRNAPTPIDICPSGPCTRASTHTAAARAKAMSA